jgi:hypothetical protein
MHTAKINLDHSRNAKIKSRGFPILESREAIDPYINPNKSQKLYNVAIFTF